MKASCIGSTFGSPKRASPQQSIVHVRQHAPLKEIAVRAHGMIPWYSRLALQPFNARAGSHAIAGLVLEYNPAAILALDSSIRSPRPSANWRGDQTCRVDTN
jgi:hypothetical protein